MGSRHAIAYLVVLFFILHPSYLILADEVQWRYDYNAARREASEKGLPLVIDFSTVNCFWCKKLDASTFRDTDVVRLLNERFVALKIDGEKDAGLAQALQIQGYPTLVYAGPNGKILGKQEGFIEAARFQEALQRVLASTSNLEWMSRDYDEAGKAVAAADYVRSVALLKTIIEDGKDRPVQVKSRQLLQDIEQQAAGRLSRAVQLDQQGQTAAATAALHDLVRTHAGTGVAAEATQTLGTLSARVEMKSQQRVLEARNVLARARDDYREQQYLCCLDRCEHLAANYADLPEGAEAMQLAAEIKGNTEWLTRTCESLSDRLGVLYLSLAESWLKKGQPQQAVVYLERVIQAFPGSRHAEVAQLRLAQARGEGKK